MNGSCWEETHVKISLGSQYHSDVSLRTLSSQFLKLSPQSQGPTRSVKLGSNDCSVGHSAILIYLVYKRMRWKIKRIKKIWNEKRLCCLKNGLDQEKKR